MTNHTDTSRSGDLVERLRREIVFRDHGDGRKTMMRLNSNGDEAADRIEALEAENERLREELAAAYIKLSGTDQHASDCATSNAPAMKPGPCDCKENEWLKRQLSQIAWLAQRPYDPDEQLTGGEDCASGGQAGSEA